MISDFEIDSDFGDFLNDFGSEEMGEYSKKGGDDMMDWGEEMWEGDMEGGGKGGKGEWDYEEEYYEEDDYGGKSGGKGVKGIPDDKQEASIDEDI